MPRRRVLDAVAVVDACYTAWVEDDLDGVLEPFDEASVYEIFVPTDVLPFAGVHEGKVAIHRCLSALLDAFALVSYDVRALVGDGDIVRAQIHYRYIHKASNLPIDGGLRHVWQVVDGGVTRLEEYHDVAMLKAAIAMLNGMRDDD